MALTATVYAKIDAKYDAASDMGGTSFSTDPRIPNVFQTFNDGVLDYQADRAFFDTRSLASATAEDLDMAGSLSGPAGSIGVFAKIKAIWVRTPKTNTTNITIKPGATNGFLGPFGAATHTLTLTPGATVLLCSPKGGWTVTAATGDLINIANSTGAIGAYDIMVIGTSA